jgi:hypothetical protein
MDANIQLNPHELTGMDQISYLHLDNKIANLQSEFQNRLSGLENRSEDKFQLMEQKIENCMAQIRVELKTLNESRSKDVGAKGLLLYVIPVVMTALQLAAMLIHH